MKYYINIKSIRQIASYVVLGLFCCVFTSCTKTVDRLTGKSNTPYVEESVQASVILACCRDNNKGVLTYPSFVPLEQVQLCEAAQVAVRRNEQINGVVYIPMDVDCDPKYGHTGSEYYAGKGY